jgi:hypothetical protein
MQIQDQVIAEIAKEVVARLRVQMQMPDKPAALGVGGAGYFSHTIATPTGEGVTTPLTFTRQRQMIVGDALRII